MGDKCLSICMRFKKVRITRSCFIGTNLTVELLLAFDAVDKRTAVRQNAGCRETV
jgi:hypothetical protein